MKLLQLEIRNFRNIGRLELIPATGVNLFRGENAQGKTNLLEAIYFLVTGRSFRTRIEKEVLPWDHNAGVVSNIRGFVRTPESEYEIVVGISSSEKKVSCNGRTLSSLGLLWGKMNAVLFAPGDLSVVQGPPGIRRRFLDMEGSQIDPGYLYQLQKFHRILKQRNAVLKTGFDEQDLSESLTVWDEQMIPPAAKVFTYRRWFLKILTKEAKKTYGDLAEKGENLELEYDNFIGNNDPALNDAAVEDLYRKILVKNRSEDVYRGTTSCGPHRDDFRILLGGRDSRTFGSQGQQKSAIISLRLAEIRMMEEYTGHTPLLLLDDIASELDERRRKHFLSRLKPGYQTFLTGTESEAIKESVAIDKTIHISGGQISTIT